MEKKSTNNFGHTVKEVERPHRGGCGESLNSRGRKSRGLGEGGTWADKMQREVLPQANLDPQDPVKSPGHYTQGGIETIDYLRAKLTREEFTGYCTGNCQKYLARWRHKGGVEDLRKASQYLGWAIGSEVAEGRL